MALKNYYMQLVKMYSALRCSHDDEKSYMHSLTVIVI